MPRKKKMELFEGGDEKDVSVCNDVREKSSEKRKRIKSSTEDESDRNRLDNDVSVDAFVDVIQGGLTKTFDSKRRKVKDFIQKCGASHKKLEDVTEKQYEGRGKLTEEYKTQFSSIMKQWSTDFEKAKDLEEKIRTLLNQQMKLISQERQVQNQRIKSLQNLHEKFIESLDETESRQSEQRQTLVEEMNKKITETQEDFVKDVEKNDMRSMKKSLLAMIDQL